MFGISHKIISEKYTDVRYQSQNYFREVYGCSVPVTKGTLNQITDFQFEALFANARQELETSNYK